MVQFTYLRLFTYWHLLISNPGYNVTSIDDDGKAWNRGESNYGEKDDSDIMTYMVDIKLDDVSERKFGEIASIISMEIRLIGKRRGYREGINGEGVTLIDRERMPNSSWDSSNDTPTNGYRSTDDVEGDTCFSRPLAMPSKVVDKYTWGHDVIVIHTNTVDSNTSQDTNDNLGIFSVKKLIHIQAISLQYDS